MKIEFLSKSQNESFARVAVASFVSQLDPTIEELALAIYCDAKYLWVAGDRKDEVMDYILNNDMTYMKNQFSI